MIIIKKLTCEMCGSTDIIKQEGFFLCQVCGVKYSLDEARKMFSGETVEIEGTVKIDQSDELENLYILARRAKENNDYNDALSYYNQILLSRPEDWEAHFYTLYCKIRLNPSLSLFEMYHKSLNSIFKSLKDINVERDLYSIFQDMYSDFHDLCKFIIRNYNADSILTCLDLVSSLEFYFGDNVISFGNQYKDIAVLAWSNGLNTLFRFKKIRMSIDWWSFLNKIAIYENKIQQYNPHYELPLGILARTKVNKYKKNLNSFTNHCPNCGMPISDDTNFCTECGTRIN